MPSLRHSTPADGSFSAAGALAWDADHDPLFQSDAGILGKITAGVGSTAELTPAEVLSFIGAEAAGTAASLVAAHEAAVNPHPDYLTPVEGDAVYSPLAHDHTGAGQTLIPVEALASTNSPANRYIWSALGATGNGKWITTTIYPATSVNLVTGTLNAGSITSFATRNDADIYDVQEVAGVPGVDIRVSFANVEAFNLLRFQVDHIDGTGTHKVEYALWNVALAQWDLLTSLRTTNGFVEADVNSDNFVDYIDAGASNTVICRLYHPISGSGGHQHKWEYMVLVDSIAGGGGISDHQALSGLDTAGSHPATAISNTPSGSIVAITVQAAINEVSVDVDTHITNNLNPHATTKAQVGLTNVTDDAQLKRAAGDFAVFTEKVTLVGADLLLLEDSAAGGAKKKVQIGNLPTGAGGGYAELQINGVPLTARTKVNLLGAAVSGADNPGTATSEVTITTGATPDLVLTKRSATADQTVPAGYSAVVVGDYEIASGFVLEIAANGVLEIT